VSDAQPRTRGQSYHYASAALIAHFALLLVALGSFSVPPHLLQPFGCSNYGIARVRLPGCH
jgi:hypothetical protein